MQSSPRLASIDCFRGFAVLVMVLATFLFGTEALPAWLRHAPHGSITVVDLGAPLFIVAIGLTFGVSLEHRWARGEPAPGANPADRGNAITEAFFEQILQWLKANDVKVITMADGCKMLIAAQKEQPGSRRSP